MVATDRQLAAASSEGGRKRQHLLSTLRSRIVEGQYAPGERIPTRLELLAEFDVSTLTLQKALDRLVEEGFLVTRGRAGTFVIDRPPHLHDFALVFPHRDHPSTPWPRFWSALASEAQRFNEAGERRMHIYYSMYGHRDTHEYRALRQAVRSRTLAGLLFCYAPRDLLESSIIRDGQVPCVSIGCVDHRRVDGIHIESRGFFEKALDYLKQRGRRRVAVVTATSVHTSDAEQAQLRELLAERGMTMHPWWFQALDPLRPRWAHPCLQLLMNPNQKERPDGLIIANDNLVEDASGGLVAAGARVPDDVDVVAHCNFPWPTSSVLPVQRLGYDARDVLDCFEQLIERAPGEKRQQEIRPIHAKFESELVTSQVVPGGFVGSPHSLSIS